MRRELREQTDQGKQSAQRQGARDHQIATQAVGDGGSGVAGFDQVEEGPRSAFRALMVAGVPIFCAVSTRLAGVTDANVRAAQAAVVDLPLQPPRRPPESRSRPRLAG